jgi:hypothetical protein
MREVFDFDALQCAWEVPAINVAMSSSQRTSSLQYNARSESPPAGMLLCMLLAFL